MPQSQLLKDNIAEIAHAAASYPKQRKIEEITHATDNTVVEEQMKRLHMQQPHLLMHIRRGYTCHSHICSHTARGDYTCSSNTCACTFDCNYTCHSHTFSCAIEDLPGNMTYHVRDSAWNQEVEVRSRLDNRSPAWASATSEASGRTIRKPLHTPSSISSSAVVSV